MTKDGNLKAEAVRISVPGRVWDLLWRDDEFYREVSSNKKVSSSGKFPRCDQWCDSDGFHMAFALAGYSPGDISINVRGNEVEIRGFCEKLGEALGDSSDRSVPSDEEDYPALTPTVAVQRGMILRGIARRNFQAKYFIHTSFDPSSMRAAMVNGLLEIVIPARDEVQSVSIDILEK
jgi:HSP20 family molecular chaperone IbpA